MDKKTKGLLEEFNNGSCIRAFDLLGCHRATRQGKAGYVFRVWAPNARMVSVAGAFNGWDTAALPMEPLSGGVWEAFTHEGFEGAPYKYYITRPDGSGVYKADPYGTCTGEKTSSAIFTEEKFPWSDGKWMREFPLREPLRAPMNIYEVHLGSWRRKADGSFYTYEELAELLPPYVKEMGYTHAELMPLGEYPFDPSWGYQVTGYYAPTARYGSPTGLKKLVDAFHKLGLGVLLDWVPAHFPKDEPGLYEFDGTCCYELSDPMMNEHPDWGTRIFDFGKPQVKSFLVSNAVYWLERFHIDGLRVDAVSSMLYLDYNRPVFRPNRYGGRENLEAMELLRAVNRAANSVRPGALMVAEESTAFPRITKPDYDGGLGFLYKWSMGWMNDTLQYMETDPIYRKYQHNKLNFTMTYAFSENFILPLSHDEVVHCKGSLINKMPGEYDWKFAGLRTLLGFQMAHPGKKLTFMGTELAQFDEWNYNTQLGWDLLEFERHRQLHEFVRDLNHFYLSHPQFWQNELDWTGFQWIDPDNAEENLLSFRRIDCRNREVLVICNFCPVARPACRLGVPRRGQYRPALCSDDPKYGGTGMTVRPAVSQSVPFRSYKLSACFDVPPMSVTFYLRENLPKKE
ncbi:MAG: 1,4-alpha-glucan branching protein GlgB [Candidatus Faecousia sp.]|nr:1,4-alpha-glucan branching protein GlgB [Bacillota bacterium]MDY4220196.1 1,4-alpha-glucan branching protein GlgB [Candidatus Faecousia sp.]